MNQNNGKNSLGLDKCFEEVNNPIADVIIHLLITSPGRSQLRTLKNLFKNFKFDFLK